MTSAEQLSSTIEKIYAAATDPALWEDALSAVADFGGSAGAVLHVIPKTEGASVRSFLGAGAREFYSADNVQEWTRDYAALCPRLAAGERWPNRPFIVDHMIMSEAEMDHHPAYQWYGKHGLRYFVGSMLPETDRMRAAWSLQRTSAEGHAQNPEIEAFLIIKRHLSQALALAVRLGTLEQQWRFGLGLLDALPYAIFALDGTGRILFANDKANRIVERADGLTVEEGRLTCRLRAQQPLLDRLLAAAVSGSDAEARGGSVPVHRTSGRRPYLALVSQIVAGEELIASFRPKVLVIVSDPDEAAVPDEQTLRDLYGLSESEARVAAALAGGHSLHSAAALLRVSNETIRFHLKGVFRKLGVTRQQDLVRNIAQVAAIDGVRPAE